MPGTPTTPGGDKGPVGKKVLKDSDWMAKKYVGGLGARVLGKYEASSCERGGGRTRKQAR
jgi:hypothetical protein